MVRRRARLHDDQFYRPVLKPAFKLRARQSCPLDDLPTCIGNGKLEHVLGKIHGNSSRIHIDSFPLDLAEMTRSQLGTPMPTKEREESIPSLVSGIYSSPLRAQCGAA